MENMFLTILLDANTRDYLKEIHEDFSTRSYSKKLRKNKWRKYDRSDLKCSL